MSRGALDWLITIPTDGKVPLDGVGPALIEWHAGPHFESRLPDQGVSLIRLEIRHPDPARVRQMLSSLGVEGAVDVVRACLVAHLDTPTGPRMFSVPKEAGKAARIDAPTQE